MGTSVPRKKSPAQLRREKSDIYLQEALESGVEDPVLVWEAKLAFYDWKLLNHYDYGAGMWSFTAAYIAAAKAHGRKPLDPHPWKCQDGVSGRFAIGDSFGVHSDCCKFKPRKGYEKRKKVYFRDNRWLTEQIVAAKVKS